MSDQQEDRRMGSLWTATSKKGDKYLKGTVDVKGERTNIVVFRAKQKRSENSPDWMILESRPFEKKIVANRFPPKRPAPSYEDDVL